MSKKGLPRTLSFNFKLIIRSNTEKGKENYSSVLTRGNVDYKSCNESNFLSVKLAGTSIPCPNLFGKVERILCRAVTVSGNLTAKWSKWCDWVDWNWCCRHGTEGDDSYISGIIRKMFQPKICCTTCCTYRQRLVDIQFNRLAPYLMSLLVIYINSKFYAPDAHFITPDNRSYLSEKWCWSYGYWFCIDLPRKTYRLCRRVWEDSNWWTLPSLRNGSKWIHSSSMRNECRSSLFIP